MTPEHVAFSALAFLIYGYGVVLAAIAYVHADNGKTLTDAVWWPIHVTKALLKSLYRALFTEWEL